MVARQPAVVSGSAVNINTATAADLEKLPYIGSRTAEAIIAYREQNGPFRRVEHLMLLPGISEKRFRSIREVVTVD